MQIFVNAAARRCLPKWLTVCGSETVGRPAERSRHGPRRQSGAESLAVWDKDWMDSPSVSNYTWAKVNKSEECYCRESFLPANNNPALSLMDSLCTQWALKWNMSDIELKSEPVYLMLKGHGCHVFIFGPSLQWSSCQWSTVQTTPNPPSSPQKI